MPLLPRIPEALHTRIDAVLTAEPPAERQMFHARLERWWPDVIEGLIGVYDQPLEVAEELLLRAAHNFTSRSPDLRQRDLERLLRPDWFQSPDVIGYAAYTERFAPGGLADVARHIDHLKALGVSYLHLMPLLEPRTPPNDGGYAVADYRRVRPDLGTMDDRRALAADLHRAGLSLCLDLVLNHVADEHEWARRARAGEQRYQDYFLVFDDRAVPDRYEQTLPEIFPDFAPGNFTKVRFATADSGASAATTGVDRWVWTTFNDYQWDLNWANPQVLAEMVDVVLFLANAGADILRLDAIAFIWKRLGTTSQNEPEVHAITQAIRAVLRITAPAVVLLAEAIVAPSELVPYLGQGRHHGRVSDLAYHNSLMVQYWSMLATRDTALAVHALQQIDSIPASTAWLTYIRCHDDIGWAIMDADAAAVGVTGFGHRGFLSDFYSGTFPGSFSTGLVFQENVETGDRRISGTAASLSGLDRALLDQDPDAAGHAIARVVLGYALMAFWGGIPVIWSGDELAQRNDPDWAADPSQAADNRWAHRPRLDWELARQVSAAAPIDPKLPGALVGPWPGTSVDQVTSATLCWQGLQRVLAARAQLDQLDASVSSRAVSSPDPALLAVRREHPFGLALGLFNVSESAREIPVEWLTQQGVDLAHCRDALSGADAARLAGSAGTVAADSISVPPYGCFWLVNHAGR